MEFHHPSKTLDSIEIRFLLLQYCVYCTQLLNLLSIASRRHAAVLKFIDSIPHEYFMYYLGPNAPPDQMHLEPMNSSTIKVVWTPIDRETARGLIRGYKIVYAKNVNGQEGRAQSKSVRELDENKVGLLVSY